VEKIVESKLFLELDSHVGNVKWSFETEVQILMNLLIFQEKIIGCLLKFW